MLCRTPYATTLHMLCMYTCKRYRYYIYYRYITGRIIVLFQRLKARESVASTRLGHTTAALRPDRPEVGRDRIWANHAPCAGSSLTALAVGAGWRFGTSVPPLRRAAAVDTTERALVLAPGCKATTRSTIWA